MAGQHKTVKVDWTDLKVRTKTEPGRHRVSAGLFLLIDYRHGGKSWVFRYRERISQKVRDKGLGAYPDVSLKAARASVAKYKSDLSKGIDPIDSRKMAIAAQRQEQAKTITFGACAMAYIDIHKAGWRNPKHTAQWITSLNTYAPELMKLPVTQIDKDIVLEALKKIWEDKTETASRVRQRIESVLDYAKAANYYTGENPARWKGGLKGMLAEPSKIKNVQHQAALPHTEISAFMEVLISRGALKSKGGLSYKALAFIILTASRASETVNARWEEIDLKAKTWTIPKERMKANREHTVPLSDKAIELLTVLMPQASGYIFQNGFDSQGNQKPITIAAPLKVCKELNPAITVHGFRSTFRNWAGAVSSYPRELAEAALAHTLKDKTEAAYMRDKLLEKRALMMADWSCFCMNFRNKL